MESSSGDNCKLMYALESEQSMVPRVKFEKPRLPCSTSMALQTLGVPIERKSAKRLSDNSGLFIRREREFNVVCKGISELKNTTKPEYPVAP